MTIAVSHCVCVSKYEAYNVFFLGEPCYRNCVSTARGQRRLFCEYAAASVTSHQKATCTTALRSGGVGGYCVHVEERDCQGEEGREIRNSRKKLHFLSTWPIGLFCQQVIISDLCANAVLPCVYFGARECLCHRPSVSQRRSVNVRGKTATFCCCSFCECIKTTRCLLRRSSSRCPSLRGPFVIDPFVSGPPPHHQPPPLPLLLPPLLPSSTTTTTRR